MRRKRNLNQRIRVLLLVAPMVLASCKDKNDSAVFSVNHRGALHTIMSGKLKAVAALDTINANSGFYALGALQDLKGEIQIFNGESFNSKVVDKGISIDNNTNAKAALLVYTEVSDWKSFEVPESVTTKHELESYIERAATERGFSLEQPFPFLIEGSVETLSWHVIDWPEGDLQHTHQKHKNSGLNGVLKNSNVTIVGFFSLHHKAVFTHHTTNIHMHFKTEDGLLAGHLDDLEVGSGMTLKLPSK